MSILVYSKDMVVLAPCPTVSNKVTYEKLINTMPKIDKTKIIPPITIGNKTK